MWVPSHQWVGTRVGKSEDSLGNKLLRAAGPRVTAGTLVRCLPCQICPLPSLFPSHGVKGGPDGDICGRSRTEATVWVGEGRCQARQSQLAAHKSLVMANQNHWQCLPKRSRDFLPGLPSGHLPGGHSGPWLRALIMGDPQA